VQVSIRPVTDDDLAAFFAFQADPASVAMAGVSARDREAFDAHWAKIRADAQTVLRTVVADGEIVGNVVCFPRDGHQELGYWLGQEFWGRGIATQAVRAFLADYDRRPLHAIVSPANAASLRILLGCGFVEVGRDDAVVSLELA
jgi:RimJ/RimL family protein N-acetyltransferase